MAACALRIVVPAHNEQDRIEPTLRDYCTHFAERALIVVVANGCTDETTQRVRALAREYENLRLIEICGRIGKGGAVRVGLATAAEPYVGFTDADGSTPAAEFGRLFERCVASNADAVIGSRWLPGARLTCKQPPARRIASRAFNAMVRLLFHVPFADTQCGAKIFKRNSLGAITRSLEAADFAFDIEILWRLMKRGAFVLEEPTAWCDRSGSRVSLVPAAARMLGTVLRMRLVGSLLWSLPYCDGIGRAHTIPVRSSPHVLVLGDYKRFQPILEELDRKGARVTLAAQALPQHRGPFFKLHFLLWYIFRSNRTYDAIAECAGGVPALIPSFTIKPSFLLDRRTRPRRISGLFWQLVYRRTHRIAADLSKAPEIAAAIFEQAEAHGFSAAFQIVGDDVSIVYRDSVSGNRVRQKLTE